MFVLYLNFKTERFWVLTILQYSSNVQSHLQKKFHWDLQGLLHKTFTWEKKTLVKSENSGKHNFAIDFTM